MLRQGNYLNSELFQQTNPRLSSRLRCFVQVCFRGGDYIQFSLISGESRDAGASEDPLREAFSHRRAPARRCGGLRVWRSLRRHTERPRTGMVNQLIFPVDLFKKGCAWTQANTSKARSKKALSVPGGCSLHVWYWSARWVMQRD